MGGSAAVIIFGGLAFTGELERVVVLLGLRVRLRLRLVNLREHVVGCFELFFFGYCNKIDLRVLLLFLFLSVIVLVCMRQSQNLEFIIIGVRFGFCRVSTLLSCNE